MSKYWFKAKKYRWGWYPATKEGWAAVVIFILLTILSGFVAAVIAKTEDEFAIIYTGIVFVLSIVLVYISYKKGEKPGWKWREDHAK